MSTWMFVHEAMRFSNETWRSDVSFLFNLNSKMAANIFKCNRPILEFFQTIVIGSYNGR